MARRRASADRPTRSAGPGPGAVKGAYFRQPQHGSRGGDSCRSPLCQLGCQETPGPEVYARAAAVARAAAWDYAWRGRSLAAGRAERAVVWLAAPPQAAEAS